jgi:hypothetical protein
MRWVGSPDDFDFDLLADQEIWAHNALFDLMVLKVSGIPLRKLTTARPICRLTWRGPVAERRCQKAAG